MAGIEYDDVVDWWENSAWKFSTMPPSSWWAYCEREGIDIDELSANPFTYEPEVAELHARMIGCPDCGNPHDMEPCKATAAMCDCCDAIRKAGLAE